MRLVPSSDGVELAVHDLPAHHLPVHERAVDARPGAGDAGAADLGPPILLVHANGFHARCFAPLAAHLTVAGRAAGPDLRGHGDSRTPPGLDFDWEDFADDVLAVVDALGWDRPLAVGHSLGGTALLLAEHRRPGTFRAMYLYEPVVGPPREPELAAGVNPIVEGALRRKPSFGSFADAYDNFASKPPLDVLDHEALLAYVEHGFAEAPDGSVTLKCMRETEAQIYRKGPEHQAFDRLPAIACPVTVGYGSLSERTPGPGAAAPLVAERLPRGRVARFEGLGHFGPLERPAELASAIDGAFGGG